MSSITFSAEVRRQREARRQKLESKTLAQVTREVREERKAAERKVAEQAFSSRR